MFPEFLIIGAGIAGLSAALELARHQVRVTIVERGAVGQESSWAGGGILSALLPWDYPDAVTRLTELGARLYPDWVAEISNISGIDPEYRTTGMLVLPPFDNERAQQWCVSHGVRLERVGADTPFPQLARNSEALLLPDVAQVRNPRLIKSLRLALERRGVRIVEHAEVTGMAIGEGRVVGVDTTAGPFRAEHYVVAAGAWSKPLLGAYAPPVDLRPICGQMLLFKAEPGLLRQIVIQSGFYLIPRADGHILAGSTLENIGFGKRTTAEARHELHAKAAALLPPLKNLEPVRHWAGLRPGSPNNVPVVARHPQIGNLYLNSGHFRYGVTMAPASAHILANLIFQHVQPIDASPYDWPGNQN